MQGYWIYKHLNKKNEIIYVGLTTNMLNRQSSHKTSAGHKNEIDKILYANAKNKTVMKIMEVYYINKYNPKYNIKDSRNDDISSLLGIEELEFIEYDEKQQQNKIKRKRFDKKLNFQQEFDKYYYELKKTIDNFVDQIKTNKCYIDSCVYSDYKFEYSEEICIYIEEFDDTDIQLIFCSSYHSFNLARYIVEVNQKTFCLIYERLVSGFDLNFESHNGLKTEEQLNWKSLDVYFYEQIQSVLPVDLDQEKSKIKEKNKKLIEKLEKELYITLKKLGSKKTNIISIEEFLSGVELIVYSSESFEIRNDKNIPGGEYYHEWILENESYKLFCKEIKNENMISSGDFYKIQYYNEKYGNIDTCYSDEIAEYY